jgi:hypothetical protein
MTKLRAIHSRSVFSCCDDIAERESLVAQASCLLTLRKKPEAQKQVAPRKCCLFSGRWSGFYRIWLNSQDRVCVTGALNIAKRRAALIECEVDVLE